MKQSTLIFFLMSTWSCLLNACEGANNSCALEGPIAARVLEEASDTFVRKVLTELHQNESLIQQFSQESPIDKKRRVSLGTINTKIINNDIKDSQEYKKLMRELSQVSKDQDKRMQAIDAQHDIEEAADGFTHESLKEMIGQAQGCEEYLSHLLEIQMPQHEERQQFWEQTTKFLDQGTVEDEKLVELIEKTTEHLETLTIALAACAKTFPPQLDTLKPPVKRKNSKPL